MNHKLLSRDEFRESVFARDKHKCVICGQPAKDAHHIIERRLWEDGGYYLNNGASLCETDHLLCEQTNISVEAVREAAGITNKVIPPHLYWDEIYDKWGNTILPNNLRTKGPLFHDESVQKILSAGGVLNDFTDYVKYPRTMHLPWSPGVGEDDRVIPNTLHFEGSEVVVTEKMDGENTSLYKDYYHARSVDSQNHPSRNRAKAIHARFAHDIPDGWRFCCENLYAKHSIEYKNLKSYLYGLSVWTDQNLCLSWDDTVDWFALVDLPMPDVLYRGPFSEQAVRSVGEKLFVDQHEGYVVRVTDAFSYRDFSKSIAKFVRKNHVQTTQHWMRGQPIIPNQLKHD